MKNTTQKTYLITGATGGLGKELIKQLYTDNKIIIVSRNASNSESLKTDFPEINIIIADIGTDEGIELLINNISGLTIDRFINLAGVQFFDHFENLTAEQIKQQIHINLTTPMLLINRLLPKFKKQDSAHIINIGSTFGTIGFPNFSTYCGSKFGLRGFSEALSRELADSSIKVSYIAPRAIDTGINSDELKEFAKQTKMNMDTPEFAAKEIITAINAEKKVFYIGFQERLFAKINSIFPAIVASALIKQNPIAKRILGK